MRSITSFDKTLLTALLASLLMFSSCATNPDGPGITNDGPELVGISVGGGKLGIGAGMLISVTADAVDSDGDELDYVWSGDGLFSGGGETVTWHVPDQYGILNLTCTVSDEEAEDSFTKQVLVGRRILNTDPGDPQEGAIHWDGSDGAPFYILQGEVEISAELELVVPGNTTIYCDGNSKLTLRGGVRFEGDTYDSQSILFTPWVANITSLTYWKGIEVNSPGKSIEVQGLFVKNAKSGLSLMLGSSQTLDMVDSKFMWCEKGVEVAQIPVRGEGLSFWECGRGLQTLALEELFLSHCSFFECKSFGLYLGATSGLCTRGQFSSSSTAVFLGSGSRMSMTGNVFSIPDPQKFVSIGDGYGANPDSLDFRCNYWGDGVDTTADILPRIERLAESPGLLIESVAGSEFASCGGLAAPAILWPEIDPEGHPLEDDPEYDDVDFSEAHIGFPAMKLKLPMENEDQIALTYIWSSSDDVYFYYDGGIADDFMGGYFDPAAISYPAQEDRNLSSSLYAVSNSELGFSLRVDVYFVMDGEIQMLSWDGFLEF